MHRLWRAALVACALLASVAADGGDYDGLEVIAGVESPLPSLTAWDFDDTVNSSDFALIFFHAPWCSHCKAVEPQFAAAAAALRGSTPPVLLARVDATVHDGLRKRFDVTAFPTLKWFSGGTASDYEGGRTAAEIEAWVRLHALEPLTTLLDDAAAAAFALPSGSALVLGLFRDVRGAEAMALRAAALELQRGFAVTDSPALAAQLTGLTEASLAPPLLVALSAHGEPPARHAGPFSAQALGDFAKTHARPLLLPFRSAAGVGAPFHVLAVLPSFPESADAAELVAELRAAALLARGPHLQFVTVDASNDSVRPALEFLFGGGPALDAALPLRQAFVFGVAFSPAGSPGPPAKFALQPLADGGFSAPQLAEFAQALLAGTLQPHVRSAPAPAPAGPVVEVVGTTFAEMVLTEALDVLVMIYAPWCPHCREMETTYLQLARRFAHVPSVRIARMDGTANDHPAVSPSGYPHIAIYPAQGGMPATFDGPRTLLSLTRFIKAHAQVPYELPLKAARDEL